MNWQQLVYVALLIMAGTVLLALSKKLGVPTEIGAGMLGAATGAARGMFPPMPPSGGK